MNPPPNVPTTSELIEGVAFYPIALVVSATIFPGLTLCIPGLIFLGAFVIIPIAAVLLVVGLVAAIIAAPFALVRAVRALHERRVESRREARLTPGYLAPHAVKIEG